MHASMENQASVWIALTARSAASEPWADGSDPGGRASAGPSSRALMRAMSRARSRGIRRRSSGSAARSSP